jgi:hypothetical protein
LPPITSSATGGAGASACVAAATGGSETTEGDGLAGGESVAAPGGAFDAPAVHPARVRIPATRIADLGIVLDMVNLHRC